MGPSTWKSSHCSSGFEIILKHDFVPRESLFLNSHILQKLIYLKNNFITKKDNLLV